MNKDKIKNNEGKIKVEGKITTEGKLTDKGKNNI